MVAFTITPSRAAARLNSGVSRMKYLAIVLTACLALLSSSDVAAQNLPEECPDAGLQGNYVVFSMTVQFSMLEYICGAIAPDTRPSFDRVLGRYQNESPSCYAATRKISELVELPQSPETIALISSYRNGSMPKESRDALLLNCHAVEASDKRGRQEREAFKRLLQMSPSIPGGG